MVAKRKTYSVEQIIRMPPDAEGGEGAGGGVEGWRFEYNTFGSHSLLGYRPPAPEAIAQRLPRKAG